MRAKQEREKQSVVKVNDELGDLLNVMNEKKTQAMQKSFSFRSHFAGFEKKAKLEDVFSLLFYFQLRSREHNFETKNDTR